jgi:Zn-finger nucleic acid-binding protein
MIMEVSWFSLLHYQIVKNGFFTQLLSHRIATGYKVRQEQVRITTLRCPNCSDEMREVQKYGIELDYCPSCNGVWLDKDGINKIAKVQSQDEFEDYQKYRHGKDDYEVDDYCSGKWSRRFLADLFDFE